MSEQKVHCRIGTAVFALSLGTMLSPGFGPVCKPAQGLPSPEQTERQVIRISEVAAVKAEPDTAYVLMTVQTERGLLADATRENEKQVQSFVAALERLGISSESIGVKNFVVGPTPIGRGYSVAQNLVITQTNINQKPAGDLAKRMAQIQDVGARFGSSCITCIGSG